jgi:hypothetical protein
MDRRRYVPSGEGLEGRALMTSLFGGKTPASALTTSVQNLPETFKQKELRIQHLPFFLEQLKPGRFVPPDAIKNIQTNLNQIAATLHAPSEALVKNFNTSLRHGFPYKTLSPDTARILNHTFGTVIASAGADPTLVQNLQQDMNQLAFADAKGVDPAYVATNDYALVLQTALAVGRPIQTPTAFSLAARDGVRINNGAAGATHNHTPALVGTYAVGATPEGSTRVQAIDAEGRVVGSASVDNNGKYTITTEPLADGTYKLRARAIDQFGHVSNPSPAFVLKVTTRQAPRTFAQENLNPPAGPLGLK